MGNPIDAFVRFTTFDRSMAMVMGPTPPGTGVMAETTSDASSKWTSPTSLYLRGSYSYLQNQAPSHFGTTLEASSDSTSGGH